MKRVLLLTGIVLMVTSAAWGGISKIQAPELKTEKVFADAFSVSGKDENEGIIGTYTGYSIEWPVSMGGMDLTALQNAVGLLALPRDFSLGDDIHQVINKLLSRESSLPVPQELNTAFFNATDFSWLDEDNPHFFRELTLVRMLDKADGAYATFCNSHTAYYGATGWIFNYDLIFDLVNNEHLEVYDIFKKGTEKAIVKKIVKQLIKDYKVKNYKELWTSLSLMPEKDCDARSQLPPLPSNINYCKGKFIFTYNPYEIAPGSVGKIIAVIPAKKLKKHMTSKAKMLFRIK